MDGRRSLGDIQQLSARVAVPVELVLGRILAVNDDDRTVDLLVAIWCVRRPECPTLDWHRPTAECGTASERLRFPVL
jgi:hypothetical protein